MEEFKQLENLLRLKSEIDLDISTIEKYESELNLKTIYDNNNDLSKTISKLKSDYTTRIDELKSSNSTSELTINKLIRSNEEKEKNIQNLLFEVNNVEAKNLKNEKLIGSLQSKINYRLLMYFIYR